MHISGNMIMWVSVISGKMIMCISVKVRNVEGNIFYIYIYGNSWMKYAYYENKNASQNQIYNMKLFSKFGITGLW